MEKEKEKHMDAFQQMAEINRQLQATNAGLLAQLTAAQHELAELKAKFSKVATERDDLRRRMNAVRAVVDLYESLK